MRFKLDPILDAEFKKIKSRLLVDVDATNEESRLIADMLVGYLELGFDEGIRISGAYEELYEPVDMSQYE